MGQPSDKWGWEQTGPVWGARAFAPRGGQDHLGLGSVSSDRILPLLAPGINVLTIHPRYWSFYSWVLDTFWAAELPRTRAAFREFYRPREALFAMACHVCDAPEHANLAGNIVGSMRVRGLAARDEFDPQFDYIKEPLGGYGLYYRSTMEMMGAVVVAGPANGFPFDAPTPVGKALAAAFGRAVDGTTVGRRMVDDSLEAAVLRDDMVAFARGACLCQLRGTDQFELPLLQDLFLHAGAPVESVARRNTLRLILDLSQTSPDVGIGRTQFRELIYFRTLEGGIYEPQPDLAVTARRWRIYQAREYFSFAFNRLFGWVVRRGLQESADGLSLVPVARLWDLIDDALDNNEFATDRYLGDQAAVRARTPVAVFVDAISSIVDLTPGLDAPWPRAKLLDEHALYDSCHNVVDDDESVVAMLALLLLLYRRFGIPIRVAELATDQDLVAEGGSLRIGMARFFTLMHRKVMAGATMSELARWVIKDFVIVQHERVATSKLPEDTFRFRRVGDHIRFFVQEAPAQFNDSRFDALSTTVHELGLVSALRDPARKLTPTGRRLLEDGDLSTGALAKAVSDLPSQPERAP
ncbi:hypothetical protein [Arthrobacter sp. ISL-65]|uniref:hypothetical protein n=1 Tax=Arthrobacter sp. ISL-65 TaxID=2819112 RepID=UPI001BE72446|nr:hypothetical protein [Arthrobacter sp. ISL-65]MBT2550534.1 hypothetical protein [Arthrobacter sp. ISL-65]